MSEQKGGFARRVMGGLRSALDAMTTIHDAVRAGNVAKVQEILDRNQALANDRSVGGMTPLHEAWRECVRLGPSKEYVEIIRLLLSKGADVNATNKAGFSILLDVTVLSNVEGQRDMREMPEYREMLAMLLAAGADVNGSARNGKAALHFAALNADMVATRLLLEHGADVEARSAEGMTPLFGTLVGHGSADVAELLISHGADIVACSRTGFTPLHCAAAEGCASMAGILVKHGADVNAKDGEGNTPLNIAACSGNADMVDALLKTRANINIANANGITPLLWAAYKGHARIAEILVNAGANVHIRSTEGWSPLGMAEDEGHSEIAGLLRKHGAKQ